MKVYRARILSGGRVTIPVAMRRELDIRPGDEMTFDLRTLRFALTRRRRRAR